MTAPTDQLTAEHTAWYDRCWDDRLLHRWVAMFTGDGVFGLRGAPDAGLRVLPTRW